MNIFAYDSLKNNITQEQLQICVLLFICDFYREVDG